jgi:hypothetical protein
MTLGGCEHENRPGVRELHPDLRARILALDEPVARQSWSDVVQRSRSGLVWSRRVPAFVALAATAAALVVGAAFGPRLSPIVNLGAHHDALPRVVAAHSRIVYVSPTKQGGFCYESAGGRTSCESKPVPLGVSWGRDQVTGTVSPAELSSVEIEFTDGTSAKPSISRLRTGVNAGFFVYDIPAGKTVAQIKEYDAGSLSSQVLWYSV